MKKLFFIILTVLVPMLSQATSIKATLKTNQVVEGTLLSFSDTLVVMKTIFYHEKMLELTPENVNYFYISGVGQFDVENGEFVPHDKEKVKLEREKAKKKEELKRVANPNLTIGRALKTSGATFMAIGVPCLATGVITCIAGHAIYATSSNAKTKSNLIETSYYLLPIGATLTIIGVPIFIEGKKIVDLNVKYTGNGAGIALNF